ncbi:7-carboxy-7-deazaguanine synthase QueE [Coralloluteibacterium stylophorae]|uniref:7-carboxy-7-deazaguanine synthase n=1 Tax=Coralloluteibacterium stylophorae TaxID=1776034 RepID=A0A8J7VSJ2_9GAMM|nr:7-carboxy-7-deazaguanine synthase QueE [Coralloluteibacterium stylophorae]MBS7456769.1 7-carboxy-7-deazaguanine synthase QueE [Coralloluteibacterium stylophorae]
MNTITAPATASSAGRSAAPAPEERLKITEIFLSLQGEALDSGRPTVFVRLTGCPLRCQYCDTAYAFHGGQWWSIDAVLAEVARHGVRHVCVTGGEPLAQKRCLALLRCLCDAGHRVSLETSGALDIGAVDPRVSRVVDLKTPHSGEMDRNRLENLRLLAPHDQVKFVLCSREDYEWARAMLRKHDLASRCEVLMSVSFGQLAPVDVADWIVADRLDVRFQMQLHKLLWNDAQGR